MFFSAAGVSFHKHGIDQPDKTSDLGTALGAADPNRSDAAGQSFNNNGLVHTYATSPTGYSAIFFGRKQPTDFYHYMKAQYDMNVLIQGWE